MRIRVRSANRVSILDIDGKIDIDSVEIIEVIGELLRYRKLDILCNFTEVTQVDYNGLSILAIAYKNVINHKGRMRFCNISTHILGLLKVAHLDTTFEIYANEEIALNSFSEAISKVEKKTLRRRFKRLFIHIDVKYNLVVRPKPVHNGRLLNISGDGIYVQAKDTFPVKTKLNLHIKFPGHPKPVKTQGVVVWSADREIQPHAYPGMGIQFINISNENQKRILDFIDRNISHRSGRGLYTEQ